jgi:hypothetical protein
MLGADENENKPGKGGKRKSSGKRTERSRKGGQPKVTPEALQAQDAAPETLPEAPIVQEPVIEEPLIEEPVAQELTDTELTDTELGAPVASTENSPEAPSTTEAPMTTEVATTDTAAVSIQTLTKAYGDYSRKSLEHARTFFGQLAGVRSFDKALQLQSDFARQTYDTFVAESRRIAELHGTLAKQRLGRLEEFMARMTRPPR